MKRLGDEIKAIGIERCPLPTNSLMPAVPASRQGRLRAAKMAKARAKARAKAKEKAENQAKADISSNPRAKANMASRKAKGRATDREDTPLIPNKGKEEMTSSSKNAKEPECA